MIFYVHQILILLLINRSAHAQEADEIEKELAMNVTQEIEYNGYVAENYKVKTSDGYILQVQRIPYGKPGPTNQPAQPILLMHGLNGESALYVDRLNDSLAFRLADKGYDVWLGNMRGNRYCQEHITLTTSNPSFWNFTWDDIAGKDLPAILTLILNTTGAPSIIYAGESLGNAVGMMLLASQPQWNKKIKIFLGIVPVTKLTYSPWIQLQLTGPLTKVTNYLPDEVLCQPFGQNNGSGSTLPFGLSCYPIICEPISGSGYDPATSFVNLPRNPIYSKHANSGTSFKILQHGGQLGMSNYFSYYNFGVVRNYIAYNSPNPPAYNLSQISTPVALYTSDNDAITGTLDLALLLRDLPNVYTHYVIPYLMFSHADINFGLPVHVNMFYDAIIDTIDSISKK